MNGTFLRILIFAVVIGLIWMGIRRIWRDWSAGFREVDRETHARDLKERQRPDVIDLKRDADGTYRPPDRDGDRRS